MKKQTLLTIILLLSSMLNAQPNADSLVHVLRSEQLNTAEQLDIYYQLFSIYIITDLDQAENYAEKGLLIAQKEKNPLMASKFHTALGRTNNMQGHFDKALSHYEAALAKSIEAKEESQTAAVYADLAIYYSIQHDYTSAIDYYIQALGLFEKLGEKRKCMVIMNNIASMYRGIENYSKSIHYLERSKEIAEELDNDEGKMQINFELGVIYYTLAMKDKTKENIHLALNYELNAYELSHKLKNKNFQSAITQALSVIYADLLKDHKSSLKYAYESLELAKEAKDPKLILSAWANISNYHRRLKEYQQSEKAALEAMKIDSTDLVMNIDLLQNLILSTIMQGKKVQATDYFYTYIDHMGEYMEKTNREIIADTETRYETEKKETRIATLEGERKLYIGLSVAALLLLLLIIGLLYYRHRLVVEKRNIAERQIKQLEQEKELIATRSALNAEKNEREIIARDLHDGVGSLLSVVKNNLHAIRSPLSSEENDNKHFNQALKSLDKSLEELRRVAHHIMPAVLIDQGIIVALDDFCRSIPNAEFHYNGETERLDSEIELVLYRCAYELVNNALRHSDATHITVHLNRDKETVYLSVVDDGKGFEIKNITNGMGLNNMRTRLAAFGGEIEISSVIGQGTEVNIEISTEVKTIDR